MAKPMKETDEDLRARIEDLRAKAKALEKDLRRVRRALDAAQAKEERRRDYAWQRIRAADAGYASVAAWRRAPYQERERRAALRAKLARMTVANGCTDAEAANAADMLQRLTGTF